MKKKYVCPQTLTRDVNIQCYMRYISKAEINNAHNMDAVMSEENNSYDIGVNNDDIWGRGDQTVY